MQITLDAYILHKIKMPRTSQCLLIGRRKIDDNQLDVVVVQLYVASDSIH